MAKGNDLNLDEMLRQQESGKDLDPDAVDENADRGDKVDDAEEEEEESKDSQETEEESEEDDAQDRDEKGRFAKKDKKDKKDADDKKAADKSGEEEEEEEESEEEAEDKQNLPIRLNKAKQQRDDARREADELRRRLADLEKTPPKKEEPKVDPVEAINAELDGLYEQVEEARADGNVKEAAKLQRQIDQKNQEIVTLKAQKIATKATDEAAENARYDVLLDQIEADVPQMDPKHDDYDRAAVRAFEYHVAAYEKMGETPSKAARMSASLLFGWGTKKAAAPTKAEPAKKEDPPPQKKVDVKKTVADAKKQPPDSSTAGTNRGDDTNIKASKLSEEEFDKLPESKKKQLRGDFL